MNRYDSFVSRTRLNRQAYFFNKSFINIGFLVLIIPIILVILSSFLIASTQRNGLHQLTYQHLMTGIVGIFIALLLAQLHLERLRTFLIPIYILTLSSLFAVRIIGVSALGAQRWINIGGINIQPSEIAKITVIITLAHLLERQQFDNPFKLLKPIILVIPPWFLVFIQPDLGSSLVFGAILLVMLFWAGMPFEWVLLFLSIVFTAIFAGIFPLGLFFWIPFMGFLAYRSLPKKFISSCLIMINLSAIAFLTPWLWTHGLKDYQRDRLTLFLDPSQDPMGGGYHLIQSTIGIGSGGIFGTGLLQGQLTRLRFIPEQHTDFIFSALGEEMGFLGTIFVVLAFFLLILSLLNIAKNAYTNFESLTVIGISTMITFQVLVNICMTIGLGPITGIPLPFMSYGRTAMIAIFIGIGFCLSVYRRAQLFKRN